MEKSTDRTTSIKSALHNAIKTLLLLIVSVHLASMGGNDSLSVLKEKTAHHLNVFEYADAMKFADQLIDISEEKKDDYSSAYGNLYKGTCELMIGNGSESLQYLERALELSSTIDNDTIKAKALNVLGIYEILEAGNSYKAQNYFLESLRHAKSINLTSLQYSIYNNLSEISIMQKDTTGLVWAKELYNLKGKDSVRYRYLGACNMARIYFQIGNVALVREYYGIALRESAKAKIEPQTTTRMLGASLMLHDGKIGQAVKEARKVVENLDFGQHVIENAMLMIDYARILNSANKYEESNKVLDSISGKVASDSIYGMLADIYQIKCANLLSMGNTTEAAECLQKAEEARNSQKIFERKNMVDERRHLVEIDEKDKSIELGRLKIEHQQAVILLLTVLIALLIAACVFIVVQYRKKQELYREIVKLDIEHTKREQQLERQGNIKGDERNGGSDSESAVLRTLYDSVCSLMEKERLYASQTFTREELIERLGTNATYLTKAISSNSGLNYSQFVNRYRIEEAKRMLSNPECADIPLSELYSRLGFGSSSSFFKIFKDSTGVSPLIWKKQINSMKNSGM